MPCGGSGGCNGNSGSQNTSFLRQISRFVGETVTIFTTSGGASGCGFTGVLLSVNRTFLRLVTDIGEAPGNPLAENICGDMDNDSDQGGIRITQNRGSGRGGCHGRDNNSRMVGSVVDIPIDRIAAFCHNAI